MHPSNISDKCVVAWRGKRITNLTMLRTSQDSDNPLYVNIVLVLTVSVLGYDNSLCQFNFSFDEDMELSHIYFQRLKRNGLPRGNEQTFRHIINIIESQGGNVFLCHNSFWYVLTKTILI